MLSIDQGALVVELMSCRLTKQLPLPPSQTNLAAVHTINKPVNKRRRRRVLVDAETLDIARHPNSNVTKGGHPEGTIRPLLCIGKIRINYRGFDKEAEGTHHQN